MNLRQFGQRLGACAVAAALAAGAAAAHDYALGSLKITHPWSPVGPQGAPTIAGYLTIANGAGTPDKLLSASSTAARSVELHQESMQDGIMRMRAVTDGLAIPAHGAVTLAPGAYHLMLIGPRRAFRAGEAIPLDLRFSREGVAHVALAVEAAKATPTAGMHM